jgi:hypothetical protein
MKGIFLCRALPSSPCHKNSTTPNFQTGSNAASKLPWLWPTTGNPVKRAASDDGGVAATRFGAGWHYDSSGGVGGFFLRGPLAKRPLTALMNSS